MLLVETHNRRDWNECDPATTMIRYKELKQQHRRTAQALGLRHSALKRGVGPLRQVRRSVPGGSCDTGFSVDSRWQALRGDICLHEMLMCDSCW